MNISYGPDYDELIVCLRWLEIDIQFLPINENKLLIDGEEHNINTFFTFVNNKLTTNKFDDECVSSVQKIMRMNVNAIKTFYSLIGKANMPDQTENQTISLPFYANKRSFSLADICLFARTYRFLYNNTFDESVMSYFNALNDLMHQKVNTKLFTDFEYLDIRVGKIVDIKEHPEADKLFIETVLFDNTRVIVSGLREHCSKESLFGKHFLFLVNLKKNKLKGVVSEGMILCAKNEVLEVLASPIECENAIVERKGEVVIRNVAKSVLDSGKDKFKKIMKGLVVSNYRLCYNDSNLTVEGFDIKVGIKEANVS